ncbi:FG-GAP repeat domain-containing protein [Sphingomicrobium clamense]|uniref:VCBS repeat-containing protein n=1 Tax=Sphingomicrobium clamense TaxID=2851013 RepID=A0ABS6V390_9SPHN|nr:VCBS repeat-containing protein [Sphingomicrobium sp. B8]MBW0144016.1 VCBS repeat-containing protein [Sphingomicrobium sp. B8]
MHSAVVSMTGLALAACQAEAPDPDLSFVIEEMRATGGENALLVADIDADGIPDLITASQDHGTVTVWQRDADAFLTPRHTIDAGAMPNWLADADMDGDGHVDLLIANHEQRFLTILHGDGAGAFGRPERIALPDALGPHPHMARPADLDGDGRMDVVVDSPESGQLFFFHRRDDGWEIETMDASGAPYLGFALADLDGDGAIDFVLPNPDHVAVRLSSRDGPITLAASGAFAVLVADINGDGHDDIVAALEGGGDNVLLYAGDGTGGFAERPTHRFAMASGGKGLASGDMDGDGITDIGVSSWNGGLALLRGSHAEPELVDLPLGSLSAPWGIAAGDIDADGRAELFVADGASDAMIMIRWNAP